MKKKWIAWVSVLVLVFQFVPNFIQGCQVFADSKISNEIILFEQDDLKVSYAVTDSEDSYIWEIKYQYQSTEMDELKRLKLQLVGDENQTLKTDLGEDWSQEEQWICSPFSEMDQNSIEITTGKAITQLQLKLQMDCKVGEDISANVLNLDSDNCFTLEVPEDIKTTDSSDSIDSETNQSETIVEQTAESTSSETEMQESSDESTSEKTAGSMYPGFPFPSNILKATASIYQNIAPKYTNDASGIYPTNSWQPTDNENVINHQGGQTSGWDGLSSWDGNPANQTNSYIYYGGTEDEADVAIRKYAKETATPGLYDVYLNVRGNEQKETKEIDIVLVVDMSGSMNEEGRAERMREGIKNFFKEINDSGKGDYVNVGFVGYSSPGGTGISSSGVITSSLGKASNTTHVNEILGGNKLGKTFSGGTFTQLGMRAAEELLNKEPNNHDKMIVVMTDGVPTASYHVKHATQFDGTIYGTEFETSLDYPANTSQLYNTDWLGRRTAASYVVDGLRIRDTWAATLGEAALIKSKGIEIHALGIQLRADPGISDSYLTLDEVKARMNLLASPGLYKDADQAADIVNYLSGLAKDVIKQFNTVVDGTISDPLGEQFLYKDKSQIEVKSVGSNIVTTLPTAAISDSGVLNVNGLNLGKDQEVQIHYQVQLNTESADFVPDKWYQMNGQTTITPHSANPDNQLDFGVPSAKGEGVTLNLKKEWQEYDGDTSSRPDKVTYEISRETTALADSWKVGTVDISGGKDKEVWTKTVSQLSLEGGTMVYLPKYNANGEKFQYKVTSENDIAGYDQKINDQCDGFINTKTVKPLNLKVIKVDAAGNPIAGADFKLTIGDQEIAKTINQAGDTFLFEGLTPGTYQLVETQTPEGYVKSDEKAELIISQDGKVKIDGQEYEIHDGVVEYIVKNQQKGLLPATGGSGKIYYWIASISLLSLLVLVALVYFYRNKARAKRHISKKLFILFLLPFGLNLLAPVSVKAEANLETTSIDFIVHKKVCESQEELKTFQEDEAADPNQLKGLNGVTFSVYEVTNYVADKLKNLSQEELKNYVMNTDKEKLLAEIDTNENPLLKEITTQTEGDEMGVAKLSVSPTVERSAYLFVETKLDTTSEQVQMDATPLLVILPVEDPKSEGTYLDTIDLYPKNTQVKKEVPTEPEEPAEKPTEKAKTSKKTGKLPQTGQTQTLISFLGVAICYGAFKLRKISKKRR